MQALACFPCLYYFQASEQSEAFYLLISPVQATM